MKLTVVLQRVGTSAVSYQSIPLVARVVQAGKVGENLLSGRWTDVVGAKAEVQRALCERLGCVVEVEWKEVGVETDHV